MLLCVSGRVGSLRACCLRSLARGSLYPAFSSSERIMPKMPHRVEVPSPGSRDMRPKHNDGRALGSRCRSSFFRVTIHAQQHARLFKAFSHWLEFAQAGRREYRVPGTRCRPILTTGGGADPASVEYPTIRWGDSASHCGCYWGTSENGRRGSRDCGSRDILALYIRCLEL